MGKANFRDDFERESVFRTAGGDGKSPASFLILLPTTIRRFAVRDWSATISRGERIGSAALSSSAIYVV
ncbi:hypothetical protein EV281_1112 [Rhizobium sp. BK418]|nr:hypothetical protein EV281_1112 [Rhizobium sp. BK418]